MGVCFRVVRWGILLVSFRLCCAAPRIAVPTLRSGDFVAPEGRARNGRSVEVDRWMAKDSETREEPATVQPMARLVTDRPRPAPDATKGFSDVTISKVGKRIWDTGSPTFEKEMSSFPSFAVHKQANSTLRTGIAQETSAKPEHSTTFPVVMRKMRLSSVSVDLKQAGLPSYPITQMDSSNVKVSVINKGISTPLPTSARSTVRPSVSTTFKEVRPTPPPQTRTTPSSKVLPSVTPPVVVTTVASVLKPTRLPPATSASKTHLSNKTNGTVGIVAVKPATILLVPDMDIQCHPGYKPDQDGECREVFE